MQSWLLIGLFLGLSAGGWAQQGPPQSSPPPSSSSDSQDASGLSRDTTFPGDRPGNTPANSAPSKTDPAKKRAPGMAPPRSDRVQADDLGSDVGQSSSKDTQIDLSPPADDAKAHPQSSTAVAEAEAETLRGSGVRGDEAAAVGENGVIFAVIFALISARKIVGHRIMACDVRDEVRRRAWLSMACRAW